MNIDHTQFFEKFTHDREALLQNIEQELDKLDVDELPIGTLSADDEDSEEPRIENGRPKHPLLERVLAYHENTIKTAVCEKGDYCQIKKKSRNEITLCSVVFDALAASGFGFPIPIATISTYCVTSLYLDRICNCSG